MAIRNIQEADFPNLVGLYRSFFTTHNIFEQDDEGTITYLKQVGLEHELLVLEENGEIKAATFIVKTGQNADGTHTRWKFKHFAYVDETAASELLKNVEDKVQLTSKSVKIELTIAENEKGLEFYKANGYNEEGKLTNHYRPGETCFIVAKSFSN